MIPTPHMEAQKDEIAKTVIMPGDPLRAKHFAETFLKDPKLVSAVRNIYAYTGTYEDIPLTIMASGMGLASIGIYSYELFNEYDVDMIIRTGTMGGVHPDVQVHDIVIAETALTESNFLDFMPLPKGFVPRADTTFTYFLEKTAREFVAERGLEGQKVHAGTILSEDMFYLHDESFWAYWRSRNVLGAEMESASLFAQAAYARKKAACICTVSDMINQPKQMTAKERAYSVNLMMEILLETIKRSFKK